MAYKLTVCGSAMEGFTFVEITTGDGEEVGRVFEQEWVGR